MLYCIRATRSYLDKPSLPSNNAFIVYNFVHLISQGCICVSAITIVLPHRTFIAQSRYSFGLHAYRLA